MKKRIYGGLIVLLFVAGSLPVAMGQGVGVGEELFSFDFEDPAQADQWTVLAGEWGIEGGQYFELADADGPLVTLTGDSDLADVAISVQGMGLVEDADWGIVFRATDIDNFYSWQFVNESLALIVYSGGERSTLYSEEFAEELNVFQDYLVIANGNQIHLYFNGELRATVEDDTHASGQVGLFAWVNAGTDVTNGGVTYDNFVVSSVGEASSVDDYWIKY